MSMDVGTLVISMMADMAQIKSDMATAKGVVGDAMTNIMDKVNMAQNALGALGVTATMSGLLSLADQSIAAAAEMYHLSEKTGVAVESLSAFRAAGKLSGTSIDEVGAGLVKLQKNMVDAQDGTGKAALAFADLGVKVVDTNGKLLPADQVMLALAKSLAGAQDGAQKTSDVLAILGRAGANLIPFMEELAIKGDLVGKVTTEQAKQALEYEQSLIRLKASTDGVIRSLALEFLPLLVKLTELFKPALEVAAALGVVFYGLPAAMALVSGGFAFLTAATTGFTTSVFTLGTTFTAMAGTAGVAMTVVQTAIALPIAAFAGWKLGEWARENFMSVQLFAIAMVDGTMTAWQNLKYAGELVWLSFKSTALGAFETVTSGLTWLLDKIGEGLKFTGAIDTGNAVLALSETIKTATKSTVDFDTESKNLKDQLDNNVKTVHDITNSMADEAIAHFNSAEKADTHKRALAGVKNATDELTKAQQRGIQAGLEYEAQLLAEGTKLQMELDLGRQLTAAEAEQIKLTADLSTGKKVLSADTEEFVRWLINENQAFKDNAAQMIADNKENQNNIDTVSKQTEQYIDQTQKLKDQREMMGLTSIEQAGLTQKRLSDKAALLEQKASILEAGGPVTALSQQYRDQAEQIRLLAGEMNAVEWAKVTKQIGDGLSSSLTDALMNGRSLWDAFKSYLINTILDGAIKNALSSVIQGGINSMLGSLGINVAGSAAGSAVGGAAGGSVVSTIAGGAGSVLGVGASGFTGTGVTGALGIGASAGAGVTTGAVTGGGAGAAVGADLGALGTGGSAAAGAGAAGASTIGLGTLAAGAVAVIVIGDMLKQSQRPFELMGTKDLSELTNVLTRQQETESGWMTVPIHAVAAQKLRVPDDGSIMYQMMGDGIPSEAVSASIQEGNYGIPAFASGTEYFGGGLRLVGERGPELEVTGPSRIFDAQTTASMLRSGGASNDEVIAELRLVREALERGNRNTAAAASSLSGQQGAPLLVQVVTA